MTLSGSPPLEAERSFWQTMSKVAPLGKRVWKRPAWGGGAIFDIVWSFHPSRRNDPSGRQCQRWLLSGSAFGNGPRAAEVPGIVSVLPSPVSPGVCLASGRPLTAQREDCGVSTCCLPMSKVPVDNNPVVVACRVAPGGWAAPKPQAPSSGWVGGKSEICVHLRDLRFLLWAGGWRPADQPHTAPGDGINS